MKINIKQEGGFIGMTSKATLDYSKLTEEEQRILEDLATPTAEEKKPTKAARKNADDDDDQIPTSSSERGLAMPPLAPPPLAADTCNYSLSMKKDGKKVSVKFNDTNAPKGLIEIFQKYIKI